MGYNIIKNVLSSPFSMRQGRLMKERPPLDEDEFVRQVSDAGGDKDAAHIIHQKLQEWTYVNDFTPYPMDSLCSVFGIAEEDLDEDLILGILNQLNVPLPSSECVAAFGPVDTPVQVARLVSLARTPNDVGAR